MEFKYLNSSLIQEFTLKKFLFVYNVDFFHSMERNEYWLQKFDYIHTKK